MQRKKNLNPSVANPAARGRGFEQQLGGRLAVWAGGVALAAAGFFLVKYSIKIGLLTPPVRVILAAVFGIGLLQAGRMVGPSRISDAVRIAQALVGAGIASLYASAYTASAVYAPIPGWEGFIRHGRGDRDRRYPILAPRRADRCAGHAGRPF